jgi:hypothetical protein
MDRLRRIEQKLNIKNDDEKKTGRDDHMARG